jgi:hypothetical protein
MLQTVQSTLRSIIESEVDRGLAMLSYALWRREHSPDDLSEATFCSARRALSVARRFYSRWFLGSELSDTESRINELKVAIDAAAPLFSGFLDPLSASEHSPNARVLTGAC